MAFAIKAEIRDPRFKALAFTAQKTMYGGKHIAQGDTVFVFASENEGGIGLIARGVVTSAEAVAKKRGVARQTPRVTINNQAHRAGAAAARPKRAQALRQLGRRPTRDRAQFQILSSGNEQDRRHLGWGGGVPERFLLGRVLN
jgi:hypothetical protein